MYVHIVDSWLQLIYIWWGFYVRMLSICQRFIDSSISGGLIPNNLFYFLQGNNNKRVFPRGTKAHWFNPYRFILSFRKAIISRDFPKCRTRIYFTDNLLVPLYFLVLEKKVFLPYFSFFRVYKNEVLFYSFYYLYLDFNHGVLYTLPSILKSLVLFIPLIEHVLDRIYISTWF